jgi:hypothetical protein
MNIAGSPRSSTLGEEKNGNRTNEKLKQKLHRDKKTDYNSETLRSLPSLPHMIIGNEN